MRRFDTVEDWIKCGGTGSGIPGPCPTGKEENDKDKQAVSTWAGFAANIPAAIAKKAKDKVVEKYQKLSGRYGSKMAVAIIVAGIAGLPLPVPGSSLLTAAPVIAAAEIMRALRKSVKAAEDDDEFEDLTDEEIAKLGKEWMQELLDEWLDENPDLVEKSDDEKALIEAWIKCGGPGSGIPGPCPKNSDEEKAAADKLVEKFKSGEKLTTADAKKLVESLSGMTVKQLGDFKREHGLKASGKKADLVDKLAAKLSTAIDKKAEESLPKARESEAIHSAESDVDAFEKATGLSYEKAGSMVGAPDDATLNVIPVTGNKAGIFIDHPQYNSYREIGHDAAGKMYMSNETFYMKDEKAGTGTGLGSKVFSDQVAAARENGVAYIKTYAAKGISDLPANGYYTWPRLGYDQRLDDFRKQSTEERATMREAAEKFGAKTVLDLMSTQAGRDWWKKNGVSLANMKFDLSDGSRSMKVHAAYMKERQRRENAA